MDYYWANMNILKSWNNVILIHIIENEHISEYIKQYALDKKIQSFHCLKKNRWETHTHTGDSRSAHAPVARHALRMQCRWGCWREKEGTQLLLL